jgi:hypothetical protein
LAIDELIIAIASTALTTTAQQASWAILVGS